MFSKIMFATDGSEYSTKALKVVIDLAKKYSAQVFVAHAYPPVSDFLGEPIYDDLVSRRVVTGNEIIDTVAKALDKEGVKYVRELIAGPPAEAIIKIAETRKCGLIVIGARGLGELTGLLVGSVSHRVVQHAHCPVMIVR